jgi:hypothetical protein
MDNVILVLMAQIWWSFQGSCYELCRKPYQIGRKNLILVFGSYLKHRFSENQAKKKKIPDLSNGKTRDK